MPKCIYCKAHVEDTPEAGMTSDFNYYHADCGKEEAMKKWDDIYRDGDESFADFGDETGDRRKVIYGLLGTPTSFDLEEAIADFGDD